MAETNDNLHSAAKAPYMTPQNASHLSQQCSSSLNLNQGASSAHTSSNTKISPSSSFRMNPPPLPQNLNTPIREMRQSSVISTGSTTRKPRQNLDERDHLLMIKHCCEQREHYKEGTKAQFWTGVGNAFQRDTGKVLAQMSATVGRLVESRRRQILDWEAGLIAKKPGGELNDLLDQWMEFLKVEDGDAEAERMRQVDNRRKLEEARKEARRNTISTETTKPPSIIENIPDPQKPQKPSDFQVSQLNRQSPAISRTYDGSFAVNSDVQKFPSSSQHHGGDLATMNGHQAPPEINNYRAQKRKRPNEHLLHGTQIQVDPVQQKWQTELPPQTDLYHRVHHNPLQISSEPARKVVIEGQLTKEDWKEIVGNDSRLRALEIKVEKMETLVAQNNKMLMQLIHSRSKNVEQDSDERVPIQPDTESEQDHL
ncbi:hypothetical protein GcC1_091020 [Golovinomyces cichoracearum]|uniref:Uncharacterized protein n=1 Tax=Golovinomyces cichoracearum TaxID=62708 RepID=A0A420IF03_9PEZI|nr:hypothetical protein GcC1_091020 [Golovinomyces cichoracearum]